MLLEHMRHRLPFARDVILLLHRRPLIGVCVQIVFEPVRAHVIDDAGLASTLHAMQRRRRR